jgi:hypothetical protein
MIGRKGFPHQWQKLSLSECAAAHMSQQTVLLLNSL